MDCSTKQKVYGLNGGEDMKGREYCCKDDMGAEKGSDKDMKSGKDYDEKKKEVEKGY